MADNGNEDRFVARLNVFETLMNLTDSIRLFSSHNADANVLSDIGEKLGAIQKKIDKKVPDEKIIESLCLSDLYEWRKQLLDIGTKKGQSAFMSESIEYIDLFIELARAKDTSLSFLAMCSNDELSSLTYWILTEAKLDKNGTLIESSRIIRPYYLATLTEGKDDLHIVLPMIEESILMQENNKAIESRYKSLLLKVCDSFRVNYHPLSSIEMLEKELLQKIWDLPFEKLTAKDIKQISLEQFRQFKFYTEWSTEYNMVIPCVLLIAAYRQKYC